MLDSAAVRARATRRMAWLSIATSIATLLLKFGAYAMTGAVSLLSDALEALVNMAAGLVALGALTIAERPPDEDHPYGHDKVEYFSSGVEGVLILVAAMAIAYTAVGRLLNPAELGELGLGLVVAGVAAALNLVTSRLMMRVAVQHDSIVLEADAKHLMTDVWTSAGVIAGLAVVMIAPEWRILDPLIAIAVAAHIAWTGFDLLRRSAGGLMDTGLDPAELATIRATLDGALPPGTSYEALRTRKAGARRFVEFKLYVPGDQTVSDAHDVCDRLEALLEERFQRVIVTIHVEPARGG
jgi:cation diffusion facilitator family transporter